MKNLTKLLTIIAIFTLGASISVAGQCPENVRKFLDFELNKAKNKKPFEQLYKLKNVVSDFSPIQKKIDAYLQKNPVDKRKAEAGIKRIEQFHNHICNNWQAIKDNIKNVEEGFGLELSNYEKGFLTKVKFYFLEQKTFEQIDIPTLYREKLNPWYSDYYDKNIGEQLLPGLKNYAVAWLATLNKIGIETTLRNSLDDSLIYRLKNCIALLCSNFHKKYFNENYDMYKLLTKADIATMLEVVSKFFEVANPADKLNEIISQRIKLTQSGQGYCSKNYLEVVNGKFPKLQVDYKNELLKLNNQNLELGISKAIKNQADAIRLSLNKLEKKRPDLFLPYYQALAKYMLAMLANANTSSSHGEKQIAENKNNLTESEFQKAKILAQIIALNQPNLKAKNLTPATKLEDIDKNFLNAIIKKMHKSKAIANSEKYDNLLKFLVEEKTNKSRF